MYTLKHEGEKVGNTALERGDPSTYSVSGIFINVGGAQAIAGWIKSVGGKEDDGVVYIQLNQDFTLVDGEGETVEFEEANLISVPAENEVYLDVVAQSDEQYKQLFAEHVSAMNVPETDS